MNMSLIQRKRFLTLPILLALALIGGFVSTAPEASAATKKAAAKKTAAKRTTATKATAKKTAARKATAKKTGVRRTPVRRTTAKKRPRPRIAGGPWTTPTYADSTAGDFIDGEDLEARRAAVEALGPFNGSVVVADPETGRLLTIVNQNLALSGGHQPCSTVKVPVALAALNEGIIDRNSKIQVHPRVRMNLTEALAKSNNPYFASLGRQLGYDRMEYYARLFGLGEKAGLDIPGEQPGHFPAAPPKNGGMGMLTSFGEEISLTPLQLASLLSAVANGGTLYYLQHPRSVDDVQSFVPRVKRRLDVSAALDEIRPGMEGAVQFGTARRIQQLTNETVLGKTGTCTENKTHLGWFGSIGEVGETKLVVVVLLTGGKPSVGPTAAGIAGAVYKSLSESDYFARLREDPSRTNQAPACCSE